MTKTTIDAECDYVDERLCGVNDMTFEEWLSYQNQMLRSYNTYQYDSGPYKEERDEDESSDESSEEDDESDDDNDDGVCLCDPTDIEAGYCCCNARGKKCNGKCQPDGYERGLESRPSYQKKTPKSKRNKTFPLKRNEKNTIYIKSGLYSLILHFKLESTDVFRFRVAKNLIVFWLLYKYLYIYIYIYIVLCVS